MATGIKFISPLSWLSAPPRGGRQRRVPPAHGDWARWPGRSPGRSATSHDCTRARQSPQPLPWMWSLQKGPAHLGALPISRRGHMGTTGKKHSSRFQNTESPYRYTIQINLDGIPSQAGLLSLLVSQKLPLFSYHQTSKPAYSEFTEPENN